MFFAASKLLTFMLTPLFWIILLLFSAIITHKTEKRIIFVIASTLILYLLSNDFIFNKIAVKWEIKPVRYETLGNFDYAIVLGGFSTYDTTCSKLKFNEDGDRLWQSIQLYQQKKVKKLFITGGSGQLMHQNETEADKVKQYLHTLNIPDSVIEIEMASRNTHENAKNTSIWIRKHKPGATCLLVTSAYHMRRAEGCFKKEGLNITPYSTNTLSEPQKYDIDNLLLPKAQIMHKWDLLIKEWVGYFTYKWSKYQ